MSLRIAVVVSLAGACVQSNAEVCGDGYVCPANSQCKILRDSHDGQMHYCATAAQLGECGDELAACDGDAGSCHQGVCVANACGNLLRDFHEACDEGDTSPGNGCSADCLSDEQCGNGVVDSSRGEECDD